jgi:hypothetical protein
MFPAPTSRDSLPREAFVTPNCSVEQFALDGIFDDLFNLHTGSSSARKSNVSGPWLTRLNRHGPFSCWGLRTTRMTRTAWLMKAKPPPSTLEFTLENA